MKTGNNILFTMIPFAACIFFYVHLCVPLILCAFHPLPQCNCLRISPPPKMLLLSHFTPLPQCNCFFISPPSHNVTYFAFHPLPQCNHFRISPPPTIRPLIFLVSSQEIFHYFSSSLNLISENVIVPPPGSQVVHFIALLLTAPLGKGLFRRT